MNIESYINSLNIEKKTCEQCENYYETEESQEKLHFVFKILFTSTDFGISIRDIIPLAHEICELSKNEDLLNLSKKDDADLPKKIIKMAKIFEKVFAEKETSSYREEDFSFTPLSLPTIPTDFSPKNRPLSMTTMNEFLDALEKDTVNTYQTLVNQVDQKGEDFPFPPYKEILDRLIRFLDKVENKNHPQVSQLRAEIEQELQQVNGPRFSKTALLTQKLFELFPNSDKVMSTKNTDQDWLKPVFYRQEDGALVFNFLCDKEVDLMFFINLRVAPIFIRGIPGNDDLVPSSYDNKAEPQKRLSFIDHDDQHARLMMRQESKFYHPNLAKKIHVTKPLWDQLPQRFYPINFYAAVLEKLKLNLNKVDDEDLKKAMILLLFFLLHEDEGGGYNLDLEFINHQFIIHQEINNNNMLNYLLDNPLTSAENGKGLEAALLFASTMIDHRFDTFAFPKEYLENEVRMKLTEARKRLFEILNDIRLNTKEENVETGTTEIECALAQEKLNKNLQMAPLSLI